MKERVEAIAPRSGVWLGTFHGLCARLLRTYAPLVGIDRGFTIYDQGDRLRAVKDAMERMELDEPGWSRPSGSMPPSAGPRTTCSLPRPGTRGGDHVGGRRPQVYAAYQKRLRESSAVDFDDLLVHMVTILKEHKDVRAELDAPVPLRPGRRVSGHEPRPVRDRPRPLGRSSEPLRHRRPRPVDLRLARGEPEQHPRLRAAISRAPRSSSSSAITGAPRTSSASPTT